MRIDRDHCRVHRWWSIGFYKGVRFLDQLINYQLLEDDCFMGYLLNGLLSSLQIGHDMSHRIVTGLWHIIRHTSHVPLRHWLVRAVLQEADITAWLSSTHITHTARAKYLQLFKNNKPRKRYEMDTVAPQHGHTVGQQLLPLQPNWIRVGTGEVIQRLPKQTLQF
jgi:hypothetical protein